MADGSPSFHHRSCHELLTSRNQAGRCAGDVGVSSVAVRRVFSRACVGRRMLRSARAARARQPRQDGRPGGSRRCRHEPGRLGGSCRSIPSGCIQHAGIPAYLGGGGLHDLQLRHARGGGRPAAGEVTVAARAGPAGRGLARSADVDRQRAGAVGLGEAAQMLETEVLAGEADSLFSAGQQQVQPSIASSARRPHTANSTPTACASPGSTPRPTVSSRIRPADSASMEASRLASRTDDGRAAAAHRAQHDPPGPGRDEAQALQQVGAPGQRGTRPGRPLLRIQHDVLSHLERLKAAVFRMPGNRRQVARIGTATASVVEDPEPHPSLLTAGGRPAARPAPPDRAPPRLCQRRAWSMSSTSCNGAPQRLAYHPIQRDLHGRPAAQTAQWPCFKV
jgi:hypothetical protein